MSTPCIEIIWENRFDAELRVDGERVPFGDAVVSAIIAGRDLNEYRSVRESAHKYGPDFLPALREAIANSNRPEAETPSTAWIETMYVHGQADTDSRLSREEFANWLSQVKAEARASANQEI